MDMSSVLRLTPPERLLISWKGSEEVKKYCEAKLIAYFDDSIATWKRQGRQFPFPLHVRFYLQFVNFSFDQIKESPKNTHNRWKQHAFVHLFLMKPSTVDEYRTASRNEVSEWFANLSPNPSNEWIIIFDSTKAREKKNRGTLLERIKSDFAKHTNRIVEIYEGSAQCWNAVQALLQASLLNSLETFVANEESFLSALKDNCKKIDFNFINYCEYQMELSRLYSSLGVWEHVLAKYDELDALLSMIIAYFAKASDKPSWLYVKPYLGEGCPLLISMAQYQKPTQISSTISLAEIRSLILAYQIIISMRLFDERLRQLTSDSAPSNALQLKSDFAAIILRYSSHCVESICEEISALELELDCSQLQCWTVVYCIETMQFVSLLTQAAHVENASHFACSLSTRKCTAMTELGRCLENDRIMKPLLNWFEKGVQLCGTLASQSNAITEIRQILSDQQQFTHYMQKYHESAIALLKHFGWKRQSKLLGWHLANFLLSSDRIEGALPYLLKFVSGLIREDASIVLLERTLKLVIEHLEASPNLYLKDLVDFYIILSIRCTDENDRHDYCKRLFAVLERNFPTKLRRSIRPNTQNSAVQINAKLLPQRLTATPGACLRITIAVTNNLPLPIDRYHIRCFFKAVPISGTASSQQKLNAGRNPLFECSFNRVDSINRFGCIWKGEYGIIHRDSIPDNHLPMNGAEDVQKSICFEEVERADGEKRELLKGDNIIELFVKVSEVGVFMLENVEIDLFETLCMDFSWMDIPEIDSDNAKRPVCFVYRKEPKVRLKPPKDGYVLSGMTQRFIIEISSGSEAIDSESTSVLQIECPNESPDLEFWDENRSEWSHKYELKLGAMEANTNRFVTLYICKALRNLVREDGDGLQKENTSAMISEKICVNWLGKEWSFAVEFRPVVAVETKTSLLEDKAVFEMLISRTGGDNWIMLPQEATLFEVVGDDEKVPKIPAKLLNPKLTPIVPMSTYRLAWLTASSKSRPLSITNDEKASIKHELRFTYRIKPTEGLDPEIPEDVYDREYVYKEITAFKIQTACYELCAQLLSSQPGAVLCRVDNACDLIVSLRSLTNKVETVIIGVEADKRFWVINESRKLLFVKESGLGQISFSVIPKMVGFLPYPSISVFCCHHLRTASDKSITHLEQRLCGDRLLSFNRTSGKQVHVLGAFHPSADQKSITSEKSGSGRLKEAKSRLTKLFD